MMTSETAQSGASLSDEQILDLAQKAGEAYPIFGIIYEKLRAQYYQQWKNADESHTKEMMFLKAKDRVLDDFIRDLVGLIQHGERVYAELQHRNSPEAREQRRLDEQGYGLNFGQGGAS